MVTANLEDPVSCYVHWKAIDDGPSATRINLDEVPNSWLCPSPALAHRLKISLCVSPSCYRGNKGKEGYFSSYLI